MGEPMPVDGHFDHQVRRGCRVERIEHVVGSPSEHVGEQIHVELVADHCGRPQDPLHDVAQSVQSSADHLVDTVGNAGLLDMQLTRPLSATLDERSALDEVVEHLTDEERVAGRSALDTFGELEPNGVESWPPARTSSSRTPSGPNPATTMRDTPSIVRTSASIAASGWA